MVAKSEDGWTLLSFVASHALEYGGPVMQRMSKDVDFRIVPFDELSIHPDLTSFIQSADLGKSHSVAETALSYSRTETGHPHGTTKKIFGVGYRDFGTFRRFVRDRFDNIVLRAYGSYRLFGRSYRSLVPCLLGLLQQLRFCDLGVR